MKSKIISHSCFMILTLICGCSSIPGPQDSGPFYARLSVHCDTPKEVKLAEPVIMRITVTNLMNEPSHMGVSGESDTFLIALYRDGNEVEMNDFGKEAQYDAQLFNWTIKRQRATIQYLGRSETIPPLADANYELDLSRSFKIDKPGEYTAIVRRNIDITHTGMVIGAMTKFFVLN